MRIKTFLFSVVLWPSVSLANLSTAPVVFESGNWTVRRTIDAMTDKASCTGIYNNNLRIQLTERELFISVRGSLRAYKFRFDDRPASNLILADDMEKRLDTIIIRANFKKALGSSRLRVNASTYSSSKDYDLDLTGIADAVENIKSGCPGEPIYGSGETQGPDETLLCGAKVVDRLREKGVSIETIQYACSN